ncbi:S1C family serine protease [Plastoroseomonas arctica]|uniref:Trypsin-like peptidase domain-containing protein n=1 Tax=Plastoroseomonas arctica TaxID=1509237 RepID=A0AAF1K1P8_9PROT|nr:serine protease [Plastoroseomonas arctica]MBR0657473.1 trypsin-like peptidase domain-containing protein [Plastoroseomonas arctica]
MRIHDLRPVLLRGVAALALIASGPAFAQPKPPPLPRVGGSAPGNTAGLPTAKPPALPPVAFNRPPAVGGTPERRAVSSGTGFVVAPRRLMTNAHVVEGCTEMRARRPDGSDVVARVDAADRTRDLALLTVQTDVGPALNFRATPGPRRGETVVTYGFPLAGLLSSGPSLTTGSVSALAGLSDDPRQIQISAPVQPGNSGGPLLDMAGLVIGVVVSKLNAQRVAQRTGDIPQNVNFAVKGQEALAFLREQNVTLTPQEGREPLRSPAEVGEIADRSVMFLRCFR